MNTIEFFEENKLRYCLSCLIKLYTYKQMFIVLHLTSDYTEIVTKNDEHTFLFI